MQHLSSVLWSNARITELMNFAQGIYLSLIKSNLAIKYTSIEKSMKEQIMEYLRPFYAQIYVKGLKVKIAVDDDLPPKVITDWNIYQCIFFHLIWNSIKTI